MYAIRSYYDLLQYITGCAGGDGVKEQFVGFLVPGKTIDDVVQVAMRAAGPDRKARCILVGGDKE